MPSALETPRNVGGTDTGSLIRRPSGRPRHSFERVFASFGAGLLALTVATTAQLAGASHADAAQKSAKQSTAKQSAKKTKKARRTPKKARSGARYNFGTWERDTTYEGYCDNSYRIGIPTVSCQDFRRY